MKRNYLLLTVLTCFVSQTSFSQETEYQIIDSLKNKISNSLFDRGEIGVFPIETVDAICKKYEFVEVEDSIYIEKLQLINSLSEDKIELTNKLKTFNEDVQELVNAKDYLDQFIRDPEPSLMFKWQYLKKAQESLDKTSHKIDLYRSKEEVFTKSEGKSPYNVGNYVLKQKGQIDGILNDASYLNSKIENLSKKIDDRKNELMHTSKTKKVLKETGTIKRTINKVDSISIGKEINGRYIKFEGTRNEYGQPSSSILITKDFLQYVKNELILPDSVVDFPIDTKDFIEYVGRGGEYLIKNIETGKLYYTTGDILGNWCMDSKSAKIYSTMGKLNIKRQTVDDKTILSYNGFQCVLTTDISSALSLNDATCIKVMNESVNKYKEYNKIASDLAVKLSNHIKLYKSRLMKDDGIASWKKDTNECNAILIKMRNLPYANSIDYNQQLEIDEVRIHTTIIDLVLYSKGKLGI